MRLFIALPVTAGVKRAIADTQKELKRRGVNGRYTPPENLHMTLVFIGNAKETEKISRALRKNPVPRTALTFDRLALFGDTLVALYKNSAALESYVRELRKALDEEEVSFDRQAFRAHVTLCRKAAPQPEGPRFWECGSTLKSVRLPVNRVLLFESDLSGKTPVYTALDSASAYSRKQ
ncbi:MAG: RNA 2',3'-cyclic phosphodiesterase [Clostridia bacterium]|nr:RNA 2',3'-cyclic phosphodiesterase [Clostridia bacterium]